MNSANIKTKNSRITKNSTIPILCKSRIMVLNNDGEIVNFEWQIGTSTFIGTTTEFTFSENGEYQITLIVIDNDGATSSTSTTIKVEPFSFSIITDLHIGRHYQEEYEGQDYYLTERLKRVVKWINENKDNIKCEENATCSIKFVTILGDITENTPLAGFCKVKEILDQLQIPYLPVFGNHDVGTDKEFEQYAKWKGQDYFNQVFWSENSIPCQNAISTKNFELLLSDLNFQRDETNKDYKNFSFSFGGINFIGLDFVSRDHVPVGYGVNPEAVALKEECAASVPTGTTCPQLIKEEQENLNWLEKKLEEFKGEPTIIFSHHPFVKDFIYAFNSEEINKLEELIKNEKVFVDFGGHIHGFEKHGIEKLPDFEKILFFNANKEYPVLSTVPVLTTEATMVGSNDENPKGIIRVIKVFGSNEISYNNWETNIDGTEFIAFNPTIDFEYFGEKTGCVFFVAHAFTKKQNCTFIWDFGDGSFDSEKEAHHCYSRPGDYEATLIVKNKNSNFEEKITRKIKIKEEAIYPRIIKIKEKAKEKIELIWSSLGKNATEFGRTMKDWVLIKVKHSSSIPVGAIFVHPEKAKKNIDLNELIADYDLEKRKSILYMPEWPETIERSKILFIPK
jgi:PKD repeat protein